MSYAAGGAAAGGVAAAHAALVQATKASGAIVKLQSTEFTKLTNKGADLLVVVSMKGIFKKKFQYLTNYRGLFIYCESENSLQFPSSVEFINAEKIWIPT